MVKSKLKSFLIVKLTILSMVLLLLLGCSEKRTSFKVGFLTHTLMDERWSIEKEIFTLQIEKYGGEVIARNADNNERLQYRLAEEMISEGVETVVVVPVNSNSAAAIARLCNENDVNIIAYDIMIDNCDLDMYISFDNVRIGEMMAEFALKEKPKGNYVLFYGDGSMNVAHWIREGMEKVLEPNISNGNISINYQSFIDNWDHEVARNKMNKILSFTDKNVDVVIASSDGIAAGVIAALESFPDNKGVTVTGQDASKTALSYIKDGKQSMSVYKSFEDLATTAANAVIKMHEDREINADTLLFNGRTMVSSILLEPSVIDSKNINGFLN